MHLVITFSSLFFAGGRGYFCWCNLRLRSGLLCSTRSHYSLPLVSLWSPDIDQLSVEAQTCCTQFPIIRNQQKNTAAECSQKVVSSPPLYFKSWNHICMKWQINSLYIVLFWTVKWSKKIHVQGFKTFWVTKQHSLISNKSCFFFPFFL